MKVYVATNGNDVWSGRLSAPNADGTDGPFATLERARDTVRALRQTTLLPDGGVTVLIRGGVYPLTQGFRLTAEDSGTERSPIVYRAYQDEQVRLMGGQVLRGFVPVNDPAVLERLDPDARGHVLQCDLAAHGVRDYGRFSSRGFGRPTTPAHLELFFQGRRMTVARWPNDDFARIAGLGEQDPAGDGHGGVLGRLEAGFYYDGDRPARWARPDHAWVHGYWAWDWANSYEQIASIDLDTRRIIIRPPYGLYGLKTGQRVYFLNILEELDQPGEYYVEAETGLLYFWPPGGIDAGEAAVSVLEEPIIRMDGVSHVTIRGIVLEDTRGHGIQIAGGTDVLIAGCTIRNVGNYAVTIDGGTGHRVIGCDVYHTGDGGIHLTGGDRVTLTPAGHVVLNNHIHHIGEWSKCYQPAVMMIGVGHRVAHNLIHDGPHSAIQLSGNEHVIEFNHIHHVCQETGDVGAFYIGRDWTQRGNVIRYNFFHDTHGYGMGSMAVYLDDCASGTTIVGNLFCRCTRAVFIGGGRDNLVENNVFVDCDPAVQVDGRGLDPRPVWHNMVSVTMKRSLDAMKPHQPPYRERYPELARLDEYYQRDSGVPPEGNRIVRNIAFGGTWLRVHWHAAPQLLDVRDNLVDEDPLFVDAARMDFRLTAQSPAHRLGFQSIPIEKIGLYRDEYRT
ncbi:MAG: right-handed parallel beta-helix repeat-containing protein [Candidatus Latescibacteria bacterium]|nr:right-handed parallel beta-helix repeat-containing protein [Candidatus Latescibacterota bacterium]